MINKTLISDRGKDLITITDFKITSAETDMEARLRPSALVNFLIHSAYLSADKLGFGYDQLKDHNLFWVTSRLTLEIDRPLMWDEVVIVETWPKDVEGLLFLRDFIVRDLKNRVVARAGSAWLAIDLETKRPKRKEHFDSDMFDYLKDKHALKDLPEKLPGVPDGDVSMVHSTYFDVDLNKHVTTSRYIDWMMDTLPLDFHKNHYPKLMSINFLKEMLPGSQLNIFKKENIEGEYAFEGINMEIAKASFRGKIGF